MCSTSLFVHTFQFYFMMFLFSHLKKALGFPRHKYCSNIRQGQMKPHFCEAFFVNTFWTIVIIVLIIEILRQPLPVVSQSSVSCPPLGQSGESHFINLSYLECIFYGPQCGCKKWQGTFKSKINCFSIQIIVFCVGRDRNTNTQGMRSQETHIAIVSSPFLTFSSCFILKNRYSFHKF